MTCTQAQPLLDAYADHALTAWQTVRVRRHLVGCAGCAAHLAAIQRLSASVQAWRNVPAPPTLKRQIVAALPPAPPAPMPPRGRRIARHAVLGLAGVAAAIGAGFWLLPGHPSQPTLAFADVERAMQQVRTVSCRTVQYCPPNRFYRDDHYAFREWDQRSPPAIANSDTVTTNPANYSRSIQTLQGQFIRTAKGEYRMHPYEALDREYLQEGVERSFRVFTQQPISQHFDNGYDYNVVAKPERRLVTFNGQQRILFTFNEDIVFRPGKSTPGITDRSQCRIWVDPATRLVARRETVNWDDPVPGHYPNVPTIVVNDDFRYNQAPPPGVFDWPPKGAKVTKF